MLLYLGCLCIVVQLAVSHPSPKVDYNGHMVLEILHKTEDDYIKLLNMEIKYDLDFWKMPKHVNDSMYVRVSPQYMEAFLNDLNSLDAKVSTLIEDVQELMDTHQSSDKLENYPKQESRRAASQARASLSLDAYHSHTDISGFLKHLSGATLNGVNVTRQVLGHSYEGREIEMIKISASHGSAQKRGMFIDGGIHAREWIAPATVMYVIEQLVYNLNRVEIYQLLADYEIYLVPVVNPDGYEYSRVYERLWRKNRRINPSSSCVGVDLNRNFDFHWNPHVGGSTNPCSDIYSGPASASEPETQAIAYFLNTQGQHIDAYLTIHSYGQMWLYPWGYTSALPMDWVDLNYGADMATSAIKRKTHQKYTIGSSTNTLYAAAGGSDDYAKGVAGIKYAYTVELRDMGRYGFMLPTNLIITAADEFLEGFLAFYEAIKSSNRKL